VTETARYGTATAMARGRLHQRLTARAGWEDHEGELPVIEGTLIRLQVDHLPGQRDADPVWLWSSRAGTAEEEVNRTWQAFLRRFDLDPPEAPQPGSRRPLDPAGHRRLRPAAPRPRPRRRHPAALAAALPARPAHPRPRPPRVPAHPPDAARSRQRAETRQAWPRTPARLEEPAPRHPPRRRQDRQARRAEEESPAGRQVK
jgi:hypothetical protein